MLCGLMRTLSMTSCSFHDNTGGTESGTGLGLYSLLKRMEALKGSCGMRQRSDGKEGSVFWFCFPYRPDPAAEDFEKRECPNGLGAFGSFDTNINTSFEEMNAGTSKGTIMFQCQLNGASYSVMSIVMVSRLL